MFQLLVQCGGVGRHEDCSECLVSAQATAWQSAASVSDGSSAKWPQQGPANQGGIAFGARVFGHLTRPWFGLLLSDQGHGRNLSPDGDSADNVA